MKVSTKIIPISFFGPKRASVREKEYETLMRLIEDEIKFGVAFGSVAICKRYLVLSTGNIQTRIKKVQNCAWL